MVLCMVLHAQESRGAKMIVESKKSIDLKTGLMVYPYCCFDMSSGFPSSCVSVFAADDAEAKNIAKFIYWRDFDVDLSVDNIEVSRFILYDPYLDQVKGSARIDKKDINLAQSQCF